MSDRYRRGIEIQQRAGLMPGDAVPNRVAEVSPDFARLAVEHVYGEIYARNGLDLETREVVAFTALVVTRAEPWQMKRHAKALRRLGMSREAISEILIQASVYIGIPATLAAIEACHDIVADSDSGGTESQTALFGAGQL